MGLPRQLLGSPSSGNSLESVSFGNTNDVDDLILLCKAGEKEGRKGSAASLVRTSGTRRKGRRRTEDRLDVKGLLEVSLSESDLVGDGSSVNLNEEEGRESATRFNLGRKLGPQMTAY